MASGSGSGSGGDGSRNANRGKGAMQNLLETIGDAVTYDDVTFHQFLQDRFGSDHPSTPNPPLTIPKFDGLDPTHNTPNTNENVSKPPPPSDYFFAGEGEEEKPTKSDLFKMHMKKSKLQDGSFHIQCNHYTKTYNVLRNFGYGTLWTHVRKIHPSEYASANNQAQIARSKKLRTSSSSSSASELGRYLEDNHIFPDEEFDLQVWWKSNQQDYPILAIIAKQILGMPVSTVAVEQEFSAGGNILDPRRSGMSPQSLEIQECVDDWTKAKYRQQELQPDIVNDFFEGDQTTRTEGSE
ncbi:hypothetical protein LWI29_007652 [Acer saccharum]|uniref:HAT C-terminal dimerisation domain-containing protein n=1 Tax=Acer saccharum TaxID=4024 RepID=A0AA39SRC5_ACESA|nr:hypothetical protein LWI29_007652 [Acer saccharum]